MPRVKRPSLATVYGSAYATVVQCCVLIVSHTMRHRLLRVMRRPQVGELRDQIGVGPYLIPRHVPICQLLQLTPKAVRARCTKPPQGWRGSGNRACRREDSHLTVLVEPRRISTNVMHDCTGIERMSS